MEHTTPSAPVSEPIPSRLPRGTVLGRYAVDGWVREGGMAALHRGHHVATGARVAIKVQRVGDEDDATIAARFVREGEVMGRLSGVPNVVQVQDMGALADGRRYLVMEWIEGDDLEERLDGLRNADAMLSIDDACLLLADVARALDACHRAAVVHRDVKPSNIMIDRGLAGREVAKLLDFGISADLGAGGQAMDLTATGIVLGTSGYVAPEQALGLPAHPSFDVYALGVVTFEAITGRAMPPEGLGPIRLPRLGELRKGVPAELEVLVERCMSPDPSRRPASAAEVAEVLEAVRSQRAAERSMAAAVVGSEASTTAGLAERSTAAGTGGQSAAVVAGGRRWPWALAGVVLLVALAVWGAMSLEWFGATDEPRTSAAVVGGSSEGDGATAPPASVATETTSEGHATTGPAPEPASDSTGSATTDGDEGSTGRADPTEAPGGDAGSSPAAARASCRRARSEAQAALERRNWSGVLRASDDRACWSSPSQRLDRKAMRARAWLELRRYDRCVAEGKGETEPRVAKLTKYCREKLSGSGG